MRLFHTLTFARVGLLIAGLSSLAATGVLADQAGRTHAENELQARSARSDAANARQPPISPNETQVLTATEEQGAASEDDYLVGIYYFAGWWQKSPNKWETAGHDWRPDYPRRVPLLGEYNDQATMDREIAAASNHGVDFFQLLWYPDGGPLNEGLRTFIASTNASRMKFTLEFVNHPPFGLTNNAEWEAACRQWCAAMKHPSYLRLDGRPVFKIHGLDYFYQQNGSAQRQVNARLDCLRRVAKENGLSNPLISGGVMPGEVPPSSRAAPFDFLTTYMDMPNLPRRTEPYPYELLIGHAEAGWFRYAEHASKPYVPYVPAGWDPRPWGDPRPSFTFPTRQEWTAALARVKAALDKYPRLGIPGKSGTRKMFLVYAWNEFGEGGIVAPTQGEEEMKLEAVRDVFGIRHGNSEGEALAPPRWFNALGTYGRNVLFWRSTERSDRSATAVSIQRREGEDGRWRATSPDLRDADRWIDEEVRAGMSYSYRARSLAGARRSEFTPVRSASPRDPSQCSLPVYELTLPEAGRNAMLANPRQDVEAEGEFHFQGQPYPVRIRLHGQSTRLARKKSYRLEFLDRSPLTRPVTFLKAEPMDHTLQQEKLSCDVFRRVGAWVSQADYVHLFINRRYEGVYLDIEPIRSPFKKNTGLDPQGTLIRASTFQHLEGWEGLGELMGKTGSLDELTEFLRQINRTDRGQFETWLRGAVDWPRIRDFLALNVVCHRLEMEANDYFFYRPKAGKWSFVPWDHNNGNFGVAPFGNRVREPSIHIFSQAIQEIGWRSPYWYVLPSRIYQDDRLRAEYLDRLEELTTSLLLSGALDAMVEHNFARLKSEYVVDPYRVAFEGPDPFLRSGPDLKRFVRQHGERLLRLIEQERNRKAPALTISEFSFGAESGWVELHNRGPEPVSLRGYLLVSKGRDGNRELPLSESEVLSPNNYTVVRCPRQTSPQKVAHQNDDDAPRDDATGASVRSDRDVAQSFPGFEPAGGFIGLVRRQPESKLERREELVDFWHYGPQPPGRSYGRFGAEFAELEPTPGRANVRAITK